MIKGFFNVPVPKNEQVLDYAPGSKEKAELKEMLRSLQSQVLDIPMYIGGEEVRTENKKPISPPHDHQHIIAHYHQGDATHVDLAINAALNAREGWENLSWEHRASIFLKAADLIAGPYRAKINAATMLGQSKNVFQAEIDAACELIDFLRFNVQYMTQIYEQQPESSKNIWNRIEQRPLEGFVFALTPFNFTAISGNLPTAPAIMGNVVVWKPSRTQIYSAHVLVEIFREAGVPDGVINLVLTDGPTIAGRVLNHPDFAGIHFTGSTRVFHGIWETIGKNIANYKTYPRIVGETGGKDFILAHSSAGAKEVATAITRGAFEYQGQKCSAASRAYIPDNLWNNVKEFLLEDLGNIKMGGTEDFTNFMNAVIDEKSFDKLAGYIDEARDNPVVEIIAGGNYDKSKGYFIEPTVLLTEDPNYVTMREELFGPIMTIYVYKAENYDDAIYLVDNTSSYALTGAIFAKDRYAIEYTTGKLKNAAGNFYINDKPTGAVVGQQPFGGARASGTNDKAGSMINLLRWVSPRTIKENFVPPKDFRYPFMDE
ncbi:MAG: L-glutamate gamma-semialdehyde dehydrogenase, partial [Cyclobacteriaceae bacterium]|nr:L-glutamate gamma-semialdehyde dehydrogenase [Cyclobacteriaceae bacterium]